MHLCQLRNKKDKVCQAVGKLSVPPQAGGDLATLGKYAGKAGKKAAEMGRFFLSEWLREPETQKMLIGKAERIAKPFLKKGIDQISTKVRPNKKYLTNRKDLDVWHPGMQGQGFINPFDLVYGFNYAPWTRPQRKGKGAQRPRPKGGGVDVHKAIGKLPKPPKGWTLPGHNYTGPYNPLEEQLRYDPMTGEILEFYQKPTGKTDAVAAQHDVDYSVCGNDRKCKNKADRKMVKSLDAIPWSERQWGHALARNVIDVKQKLGLGTPKNVRRF